uniref:Uncharacterized protein n=1 Tax=Anguilla anguilla TaxID=7936 RepID=A0A0E9RP42_ANGAN
MQFSADEIVFYSMRFRFERLRPHPFSILANHMLP